MRKLLLILPFLFSWSAFAEEADVLSVEPISHITLYPLGFESRLEQGSDLEWTTLNALNFAASFERDRWSILAEYGRLTEDSSEGNTSISREYRNLLIWGRWAFFRDQSEPQMMLYGAVGVGAYEEKITTKILGSSSDDSSGLQMISGAAVGVEFRTPIPQGAIVGAVEGRALVGSYLDTNPAWSGVVRIGFLFTL